MAVKKFDSKSIVTAEKLTRPKAALVNLIKILQLRVQKRRN